MPKKILNKTVEQIANELKKFPWTNIEKYALWLAQTFFYVRHTSKFLEIVESLHRKRGEDSLLSHNLQHQKEEFGHELLLLSDLESLGFEISRFEEFPFTQLLYNYQYYWLERRKSTAAHQAYALLFEGLAAKIGPELVETLKKEYGNGTARFLEVHAKADVDHYQEGLRALDEFSESETQEFIASLLVTAQFYSTILKLIKGMAGLELKEAEFNTIAAPQNTVREIINILHAVPQRVFRLPEDSDLTDNPESVTEYGRVANTNMMSNYCITMDLAYRCLENPGSGTAIDLASGPGILAKLYVQQKIVESLTGFDLSPQMVTLANQKSASKNIRFQSGDVRTLKTEKADLVTFNNSAHHLDSLNDVSMAIQTAENCCSSQGVILITDLARLPNYEAIDRFALFAGSEFIKNKMFWMYEDFRRSLYAAWTPEELASCIPTSTERKWYQITSGALPFYQALIGLPASRQKIFLRESRTWEATGLLASPEAVGGYFLMKDLLNESQAQEIIPNWRITKKAA